MSKSKLDHKERKEIRKERRQKSRNIMKGIAWGLLTNFLLIVHILLDKIIEAVLNWYWTEKKSCSSLRENFFVTKSAVEIAEMIRKKELTSYQVVKAYIDRMKEINKVLNAVVDGPFEDALAEAEAIDERIARGQISEDEFSEKPFLGVPFTTKDSTTIKGRLHTLGIVSRKATIAKEDAECVKLIKQAGGIIIASSNIPEVNRWQESRNNIVGQTNNPYDTRRTVGGSSGGEAALISGCATAFGIGTDIGGSIRMPAFYCGIFGHKPTSGVADTKGCTFRTGKEQSTMVVVGPMTRYATDLLPLFKILVGPKNCISLKLDEKVNVKKLRYFYITDLGDMRCAPLGSEMKNVMNKVVSHCNNIAVEPCKQAKLPGTEYTSKMWRYWMTQEPQDFNTLLGNGARLNPYVEIIKKVVGQSDFTLASIYSLIDSLLPAGDANALKQITKECDDALTELLGDDGILIFPSTSSSAAFHYAPLIQVYKFSYWCLFNVLHVPATQVPIGLDSKGLPLGIQVVASRNRDRHCLAVAEELERAFSGWIAPFRIEK